MGLVVHRCIQIDSIRVMITPSFEALFSQKIRLEDEEHLDQAVSEEKLQQDGREMLADSGNKGEKATPSS